MLNVVSHVDVLLTQAKTQLSIFMQLKRVVPLGNEAYLVRVNSMLHLDKLPFDSHLLPLAGIAHTSILELCPSLLYFHVDLSFLCGYSQMVLAFLPAED